MAFSRPFLFLCIASWAHAAVTPLNPTVQARNAPEHSVQDTYIAIRRSLAAVSLGKRESFKSDQPIILEKSWSGATLMSMYVVHIRTSFVLSMLLLTLTFQGCIQRHSSKQRECHSERSRWPGSHLHDLLRQRASNCGAHNRRKRRPDQQHHQFSRSRFPELHR
jgi:hypothetical protein